MDMIEKRTIARLDEKDVTTDFIYAEIFQNNYLETPDDQGHINDLIGFYQGSLLEAKWVYKSNRVAFRFVDLPERYATQSAKNSLLAYLRAMPSNNEGLDVEIIQSSGWLLVDFYFTKG